MALKVFWTSDATESFNSAISYLESNWTDKEVRNFVKATDRTIVLISNFPRIFRRSAKKNIHQAVITKQTSLFYQVEKKHIELLLFWDNRRNPKSLKL